MTEKKTSRRMSIFDMLRSKSTDEPEMITIREEIKSLVMILKAKPKAIKHMSEVLRPGRTSTPVRATSCLACGAPTPADSDACPRCHAKYVRDLLPGAIAELERAELTAVGSSGYGDDNGDDPGFDEFPIIHFDAVDGVINYLEHTEGQSDFLLECSNCGTLIQLDIDRCPLCGNPLEVSDVGLLSLIQDSDFDEECLSELECPHCGEHVTLGDGRCPACNSIIVDLTPENPGRKVIPLIDSENVVFIHIDLETGNLNYLQKYINSVTIEHTSIKLDGIGNDGLNESLQGLSRI